MGAGSEWAMGVYAPQGETLTYYSIYWYVAGKSSGGDVFSEVWSGGSELENGENTLNARYSPEAHTLPTGATGIVLAVYCSTDDYSNPCKYSEPNTPAIAVYGSAIVVSDPTPPTGGLTGGGLDGSGPVSGTQSISYNASDALAGVQSVQLLVDGTVVGSNSYTGNCSFANFQPCPASELGSLSWNTASVPNGPHEVVVQITNAAGNTTMIGDHAIATSNSAGSGGPGGSGGSGSGGGTGGVNGSNGTNGSNGAAGAGGAGGQATVDVLGSGSALGSVLLGSGSRWRVSLSVSPRRVRRRTKVRLSGVVSTSPRPGTGKLIYLQARSVGSARRGRRRVTVFGKWITFEAFRAKSNGTFSSTYTFKLGGHHTYQFQAVAPAEGQYRNPTGTSSTITVKES
jgi:hypothetical protein